MRCGRLELLEGECEGCCGGGGFAGGGFGGVGAFEELGAFAVAFFGSGAPFACVGGCGGEFFFEALELGLVGG